jgi:alkylation response protein AidB-like acyl-CoA dehydrogenase
VFTDYFVPDDHVLGEIDGAWKQAISELGWASSGSSNPLRAEPTSHFEARHAFVAR